MCCTIFPNSIPLSHKAELGENLSEVVLGSSEGLVGASGRISQFLVGITNGLSHDLSLNMYIITCVAAHYFVPYLP
jgi:hypothetical protein